MPILPCYHFHVSHILRFMHSHSMQSHAFKSHAISCRFQTFHAFISMRHNHATFIHAFNVMLISYIAPVQFNHTCNAKFLMHSFPCLIHITHAFNAKFPVHSFPCLIHITHAFNAKFISNIAPMQFIHGPTHAIFLTCSIPMQCSSHGIATMQFKPWSNPCNSTKLTHSRGVVYAHTLKLPNWASYSTARFMGY